VKADSDRAAFFYSRLMRSKRMGVWMLTLGAALSVACSTDDPSEDQSSQGAGGAPKAASEFATDADGWTVVGDAQTTSVTADFKGTGGNPGGLITAKDDVTGGTYYFVAPSKYYGDASGSYGKLLTFDLMTTSAASPFVAYGVMLSGGGVTIVALLPKDPTPANTWQGYSFALDESGPWKVVSDVNISAETDLSKAPAATKQDLTTVLGALTALRIRGEFNDGPDTGSLDNVKFGI
jgi:hypothetical protein